MSGCQGQRASTVLQVYFDIGTFYERMGHGILRGAAEARGFSLGLARAPRAWPTLVRGEPRPTGQ
eukprot:4845311-Pyramimonas_sp.AAC.1